MFFVLNRFYEVKRIVEEGGRVELRDSAPIHRWLLPVDARLLVRNGRDAEALQDARPIGGEAHSAVAWTAE